MLRRSRASKNDISRPVNPGLGFQRSSPFYGGGNEPGKRREADVERVEGPEIIAAAPFNIHRAMNSKLLQMRPDPIPNR